MKFAKALVLTACVAMTMAGSSAEDKHKKAAKKTMKRVDLNGDKKISLAEAQVACAKGEWGKGVTPAQCEAGFKAADTNNNGYVDKKELTKAYKREKYTGEKSLGKTSKWGKTDKKTDKGKTDAGKTDAGKTDGKPAVKKTDVSKADKGKTDAGKADGKPAVKKTAAAAAAAAAQKIISDVMSKCQAVAKACGMAIGGEKDRLKQKPECKKAGDCMKAQMQSISKANLQLACSISDEEHKKLWTAEADKTKDALLDEVAKDTGRSSKDVLVDHVVDVGIRGCRAHKKTVQQQTGGKKRRRAMEDAYAWSWSMWMDAGDDQKPNHRRAVQLM